MTEKKVTATTGELYMLNTFDTTIKVSVINIAISSYTKNEHVYN